MDAPDHVLAFAPAGVGEVSAGQDPAAVFLTALRESGQALERGDIVVVTSKVVSKAEGRVVDGDREGHIDAETARVVARRGPLRIVRTHHGLTLAAAGIDESNVTAGRSVLLPIDPDGSAERIRASLASATGVEVGVIVTDTAGRPWREGQTDIAIGAAGLRVLDDYEGLRDTYGNELAVTAPAVADEIAGLADLARPKLSGRPFVVVRGLAELVEPAEGGRASRARDLVRNDDGDLFGLGARDAVVAAVAASAGDLSQPPVGFGVRASWAELHEALESTGVAYDSPLAGVLAAAHGWTRDELAQATRGDT